MCVRLCVFLCVLVDPVYVYVFCVDCVFHADSFVCILCLYCMAFNAKFPVAIVFMCAYCVYLCVCLCVFVCMCVYLCIYKPHRALDLNGYWG